MSESTSRSVECPLCGEEFDPTAAGGWCTNSECGEWQYDGEIATDDEDDAPEEDEANDVTGDSLFGDDEAASADDAELDLEDGDAESEAEPELDDEPASADDADAALELGDEDVAELGACPECDTAVGPSDAFCPGCGEDLDAHRGDDEDEADTLDACPSCGGDIDPSDAFCPGCGEDLDAHREGEADAGAAGSAAAPSTLALTVYGRSVVVGDDDTVGRQIRSLLAEAGKNEDQAVRIHREHVRFVREDGQFYVVDLGENPTAVNGATMSKGDREPIGPGDELELSDVVTLDVEAP